MTVRVTSLHGDTAGAYYVERSGQYYLDGDEPPGVWRGRGAESWAWRAWWMTRCSWR